MAASRLSSYILSVLVMDDHLLFACGCCSISWFED